jgi:peptide/nickel transport system permease protein
MAFPFLMAVAIVSALGPGLVNVVVALALLGLGDLLPRPGARHVPEGQEFVQAVRAMGADMRIIRRLLPNVVPALLVISSFQVGRWSSPVG